MANWISRGLLTVLWTLPKLPEGRKVIGGPNCGRLKRLKNSARNSRPSLSAGPKVVLLNTAKSKLRIPCWRRLESTRGSFPNVNALGCEKQEVLNHHSVWTQHCRIVLPCSRGHDWDALLHRRLGWDLR